MLKFFRNIRKKLAAENKFASYLRYAIGEIFLIVIGILIALQINIYNQERKDNREEIQLLNNYIHDLKTDVASIDKAIKGNYIILNGQDSLLKLISDRQREIYDDRKLFLYSVKYTYWYPLVEFSELAISQLKYADGLQLIQDPETVNSILQYDAGISSCKKMYLELERYFHVQEESQKQIFNLPLAHEFFLVLRKDLSKMYSPISEIDQITLRGNYFIHTDAEFLIKYYNDVLFFNTALSNANIYIQAQKEKAQQLITTIKSRNELNN